MLLDHANMLLSNASWNSEHLPANIDCLFKLSEALLLWLLCLLSLSCSCLLGPPCYKDGVAENLPLSLQEMSPHHEDNMTSMNLNMYPSTEGHTFPPGAQRIWSHTDYEALTLLFQKPGNECYIRTSP